MFFSYGTGKINGGIFVKPADITIADKPYRETNSELMITKFIPRLSLFAAVLTFIYCLGANISLAESLSRALILFSGFYVILVAFFITVRLVSEPDRQRPEEEVEQLKVTEVIENSVNVNQATRGAETVKVASS